VCNLYSFGTSIEAFRAFVKSFEVAERLGNFAPYPGIFPDYAAPILRYGPNGLLLTAARWGMPSPRSLLEKSTEARAGKLAARGNPLTSSSCGALSPTPASPTSAILPAPTGGAGST
jgi:hypothetical protein